MMPWCNSNHRYRRNHRFHVLLSTNMLSLLSMCTGGAGINDNKLSHRCSATVSPMGTISECPWVGSQQRCISSSFHHPNQDNYLNIVKIKEFMPSQDLFMPKFLMGLTTVRLSIKAKKQTIVALQKCCCKGFAWPHHSSAQTLKNRV